MIFWGPFSTSQNFSLSVNIMLQMDVMFNYLVEALCHQDMFFSPASLDSMVKAFHYNPRMLVSMIN